MIEEDLRKIFENVRDSPTRRVVCRANQKSRLIHASRVSRGELEEEADFLSSGAKYQYVFGNHGAVALRLQMH